MYNLFIVGLGGFLGASARYIVYLLSYRIWSNTVFPYGTLIINVVGCLLLGLVAGMMEHRQVLSSDMRLLLVTGFIGSFTTFSAFSSETFELMRNHHIALTVFNISLQIGVGLIGIWLGFLAGTLRYR